MRIIVLGAQRFLYTDMFRDGNMTSLDGGAATMVRTTRKAIVAAGEVSSLADLHQLQGTGAEGVVVGSTLYNGYVDLDEAMESVGYD